MALGLGLYFLSLLLTIMTAIGLLALHIYGAILGFRKKWYIGLLALLIGWFGIIIGGAKFFFKKDLLK